MDNTECHNSQQQFKTNGNVIVAWETDGPDNDQFSIHNGFATQPHATLITSPMRLFVHHIT